jgi:hypothetical protein
VKADDLVSLRDRILDRDVKVGKRPMEPPEHLLRLEHLTLLNHHVTSWIDYEIQNHSRAGTMTTPLIEGVAFLAPQEEVEPREPEGPQDSVPNLAAG